MTQIERVIATARGELGYTESPAGSNRTKYGEAYGWNGVPWCVIFLWWVFLRAGLSVLFFGGARTASCGTLRAWYKAQGQTVPVDQVKPGDIVLLNFHGGTEAEHCGLVEAAGTGWVRTIEGNTSPGLEGSQDNGGCVALKRRYPRQIVGVLRPMYEKEKPAADWKGHWAEEEIKRCMERGIIKGYPDGSFAPDKPITRAEAAVMIDRLIQLSIENDGGKQ